MYRWLDDVHACIYNFSLHIRYLEEPCGETIKRIKLYTYVSIYNVHVHIYIYIYVSCIRMCVYMYEYVHIRAGTKIAKQHSKLQQEQTNIQSSHMFLSMLV